MLQHKKKTDSNVQWKHITILLNLNKPDLLGIVHIYIYNLMIYVNRI